MVEGGTTIHAGLTRHGDGGVMGAFADWPMAPDDSQKESRALKFDLQRAIAEWSTALTSGDQTQIAVTINRLSGDLTRLRDSLMPAAWEEATLTLRSSQLLPILL